MVNITKNYSKQCEQAKEIQRAWKPKEGDNIYITENKKIIYFDKEENSHYSFTIKKGIFTYDNSRLNEFDVVYSKYLRKNGKWLPTQEQLQEMAMPIFLKKFSTAYALQNDPSFIHRMFVAEFEKWVNRSSPSKDKYMVMFSSLIELLFAFVMHVKYNKIWTGKKWVLINEKNNL